MKTIKQCFKNILRGSEKESRFAAREVRKILYGARTEKNEFADIKNIIARAPEEYAGILEDWRKENFVVAVSVIYYLHDKEEHPDFLFPWLFQLLQHENGVIRYAAVRMFGNELGPLTAYIRVSGYTSSRLQPEQADKILHSLFMELHGLMAVLWRPRHKRYKYIDSLPASPYKSVQMVLAEMEDMCGNEYMNRLAYSMR
jgi:hypothetical protein